MINDKMEELRNSLLEQLRTSKGILAELRERAEAKQKEIDALVGAIQGVDASRRLIAEAEAEATKAADPLEDNPKPTLKEVGGTRKGKKGSR